MQLWTIDAVLLALSVMHPLPRCLGDSVGSLWPLWLRHLHSGETWLGCTCSEADINIWAASEVHLGRSYLSKISMARSQLLAMAAALPVLRHVNPLPLLLASDAFKLSPCRARSCRQWVGRVATLAGDRAAEVRRAATAALEVVYRAMDGPTLLAHIAAAGPTEQASPSISFYVSFSICG